MQGFFCFRIASSNIFACIDSSLYFYLTVRRKFDFHRGYQMQFKIISGIAMLSLVIGMLVSCSGQHDDNSTEMKSDAAYFPPPDSEGGWRVDSSAEFIRSLGIAPETLQEFGQFNLEVPNGDWKPYSDYKGIIVIKDGWVIGEWYNIPAAKNFRTYISSNGKSFAAMCFGIMEKDSQQGNIQYEIDENSQVYNEHWLPEGFPLSDPRKADITFENIFRHNSGICPERTNSGIMVEKGRNEWTDYVDWIVGHDAKWPVTGKLVFSPGHPEEWESSAGNGMLSIGYSSVAFGHIGLVLRNVYNQPASDFLWNRLCKPIGFSGLEFHAPPSDSIRWFSAGGLRMNPRDYARFAYFLLNDGKWKDDRIVPDGWVERFRTKPYYPNIASNSNGDFGEQYPADMFRIAGSGLNWAFIVPSLNLIALRTGRSSNKNWDAVEKEFIERLFACVVNCNE